MKIRFMTADVKNTVLLKSAYGVAVALPKPPAGDWEIFQIDPVASDKGTNYTQLNYWLRERQ